MNLPALSITALAVLAATPVDARSRAADYLVQQEIAAACTGAGGRIDPAAAIEADLTGDGRPDFVISHDGITCEGGGRSSFCGAQLCSVNIYVRRGPLLELEREMLGTGVSIGAGSPPTIKMHGMGGRPGSVRWTGSGFR